MGAVNTGHSRSLRRSVWIISPTPLHQQQQPEPLLRGRMKPRFHVVYSNSDHTIRILQQISRLIRPDNSFPSVVQWKTRTNCSLTFLLLADGSGLLQPVCFKVLCIQNLLHTLVVTNGYLSYCHLLNRSKQSSHFPLTSGNNTAQQFLFSTSFTCMT